MAHEPDDVPIASLDSKKIELINIENFKKDKGTKKHEKYISLSDASTRENSG